MRRVMELVMRWRWLLAALVVVALCAVYYFTWRSEHARVDGLLVQSEQALAAREFATAREHLFAYLAARPDDARARLLLARVARRLRNFDEAAETLRQCRDQGGDRDAIDVEQALIAVDRGDATPVPALRARVAEKDDDLSLVILESLIQYDLDQYRLRDALQGFNLYLTRKPDDLHALVGRGVLFERLQMFADAVVDYRKGAVAHPSNEQARRRLAAALLIVGTPAEALEHYRWLEAHAPHDATVRLGLAKCHRLLNRPDEARAILDEIIASSLDRLESTPDYAEVLWERGQLEMDRGRPADAEPWLRRADEAAPFDRRIVFSYFSCLQALERKVEAEAVNKRVAQIDADLRDLDGIRHRVMGNPNDVALRLAGGKLFLRNGEREEAIRWLQLAANLEPKNEEVRKALEEARSSKPKRK